MRDTGIDEKTLLKYYRQSFPAINVSVSHTLQTCPSMFTGLEAINAALLTAHLPVANHILRRNKLRTCCVPHIYINTVTEPVHASSRRLRNHIVDKIKLGKKLLRKEKGLLESSIFSVRNRVRYTLAYVINRCFPDYEYIALPLLLLISGGEPHANMIFISKTGRHVNIICYEPNGMKQFIKYGTEGHLFDNIENTLPDLLKDRRMSVSFRPVGSGIQTMLGEIDIRRHGNRITTIKRGYPICEAICFYVFSQFLKDPNRSLAEYDARTARKLENKHSRHMMQEQILDFLHETAQWTEEYYRPELTKQIHRVFDNSNVTDVDVKYGKERIEIEIPRCE